MADSCIVCLGDLLQEERKSPDAPDATDGPSPRVPDSGALGKAAAVLSNADDVELVAHLLPCGHNLHNECLKPWVERANSCPICRASFNTVELSQYVGGTVIDTYVVQDKQQQADIDPSMVVDDDLFDEPTNEACLVCEEYGQVMLCDGCNQACHVACAGLDDVPSGAWFCYDCMADPQILHNASNTRPRPAPRQRTTTGRHARRAPRQPTQNQREWARVWQEVQQRIDLDLEFPFEDSSEDIQRVEIERLLHDERMRRRTRVAERVGAGQRFQAAVAALQAPRPDPESQENLRAWNAFDKQFQLGQDDSDASISTNRRKRKSPTQSPAQPEQAPSEPARPLKRPRTRRTQDPPGNAGESSAAAAPPPAPATAAASATTVPPTARSEANNNPTFLQSLLKEVETKPLTSGSEAASPPADPIHPHAEHSQSPRPSSPELSPNPSNHPSPRVMTPPPALSSPRPSSPAALTSVISPIYPVAPEFSPYSPLEEDSIERARGRPRRQPVERERAAVTANSSPENSPTRGHSSLTYSTKSEIQRMVRSALRPLYNDKKVNKDEYTDINRDVSRLLYDMVEGNKTGLEDEKHRQQLQSVAHEEVDKAVQALRSQSPPAMEATHDEPKIVAQEA